MQFFSDMLSIVFFFFKQKTAYEMRISDWSSDVCSSDLQFRVFATRDGKPVDPKEVQLAITLTRLGGDVDRFTFRPQGKFLAGQGVVTEPHSFDVEVVEVTGGKRHVWKYANPEGDRQSTRLNARHQCASRMPTSASKKNK